MKNIIVLIYLFCSIKLNSQKHDYVWMWSHNSLADPGIENNVLLFNNGIRTIMQRHSPFMNDQVNASISDKMAIFYFTSMAAT